MKQERENEWSGKKIINNNNENGSNYDVIINGLEKKQR